MFLYWINLKLGLQHNEYDRFHNAMSDMNAKHPDFGGGMLGALVCHSQPIEVVSMLITENMKKSKDLIIEEVTTETLEAKHLGYTSLIENFYTPFHDLPNIE